MYEEIPKTAGNNRNTGPVIIGGDFNARLQEAPDEEEKEIIGEHTFQRLATNLGLLSEDMLENMQLLINMAREHNLIAVNTFYRKPEHKLATYRKVGADRTQNPSRANHEQIDYWMVGRRWRRMIIDAESDMNANIDSDHYPVKLKCKFALKQRPHIRPPKPKPKYHDCTEEQTNEIN